MRDKKIRQCKEGWMDISSRSFEGLLYILYYAFGVNECGGLRKKNNMVEVLSVLYFFSDQVSFVLREKFYIFSL